MKFYVVFLVLIFLFIGIFFYFIIMYSYVDDLDFKIVFLIYNGRLE